MGKSQKHLIRMLEEYGYQKFIYKKNMNLAETYEKLIEDEMGVKSKSFDSIPIHNPSDYLKELMHEQYEYELNSKRAKDEMDRIWKREHFTERFAALNDIEKKIIELRYFECMSQDKVSRVIQYCDKSYISKKENKAIIKMLKVKFE